MSAPDPSLALASGWQGSSREQRTQGWAGSVVLRASPVRDVPKMLPVGSPFWFVPQEAKWVFGGVGVESVPKKKPQLEEGPVSAPCLCLLC